MGKSYDLDAQAHLVKILKPSLDWWASLVPGRKWTVNASGEVWSLYDPADYDFPLNDTDAKYWESVNSYSYEDLMFLLEGCVTGKLRGRYFAALKQWFNLMNHLDGGYEWYLVRLTADQRLRALDLAIHNHKGDI